MNNTINRKTLKKAGKDIINRTGDQIFRFTAMYAIFSYFCTIQLTTVESFNERYSVLNWRICYFLSGALPFSILYLKAIITIILLYIFFSWIMKSIFQYSYRTYILDNVVTDCSGSYEFIPKGNNSLIKRYVILMVQNTIIIYLYTLLLIIPGVIKAYQYYFADLIAIDNPELSYADCRKKSAELTNGYKLELLKFDLSNILLHFLNVVTAGLAAFFTYPYLETYRTEVYLDLKKANGID